MQEAALVLRHACAVVSCRIITPRGPGWHCAENWQALELQALEVIAHTMTAGPYISPCPPDLARQALFVPPDEPVQPSLFDLEMGGARYGLV